MGFTVAGTKTSGDRPAALLLPPLAIALVAVFVVFRVVYAVVTVDGPSMEPTLRSWDYLLVTRDYTDPRRGDIVSIAPSGTGDIPVVKRLIALPGDTIEMTGQSATVNGVPEPWPVATVPGGVRRQPITVPADSVWVMGDNRDASLDSRFYGFVPLSRIRGRAFAVYWPPSHARRLDDGASSR